ncbi:interferon-induced protein 44-like isoform X2 [Mustelus asterias]
MSAITSRLTAKNQKDLSEILGKVNLHLLYKASVHGFSAKAFHDKCDGQGPTLTVGYKDSQCIFGGYTSEDFGTDESKMDDKAFLFQLNDAGSVKKFDVEPRTVDHLSLLQHGPSFGSRVFLPYGKKKISNLGQSSWSKKNLPFEDNVDLVECEVYRVEELKAPWRKINLNAGRRLKLIQSIQSYKLYRNTVPKARVLLIGPIGGGKSSFINSVNSIFRGVVTNRALAGGITGTEMYSTYSFRQKDKTSPPLILSDTMGLAEGTESGIHVDDIINIVEGHVPKKYQFNEASPIQADTKGYIKSPAIAERIHCVVYVIDANKPTILSPAMEKKMCAIQSQIAELEIPQVVLLTKVDEACPLIGKDLENIYWNEHIEQKVLEVQRKLRMPVSCIFPVTNYWLDINLVFTMDILILSALLQILRFVDDYFENLDD